MEALVGWGAVIAVVLAYDRWAIKTGHTTMSSLFRSGARHRRARWGLVAVWAWITSHLFFGTPLW